MRVLLTSLVAVTTALSMSSAPLVAGQQAPDRSKAPVPGDPPALRLPPIDKRTLSNGLPVWIVEAHEVPVVNVTLIIKSGAAADPAGR